MKALILFVGSALICSSAFAHHSFAAYDQMNVIEVEGTLLDLRWTNPHVHFKLRSMDSQGKATEWDIEGNSVSILRRTDVTSESLHVGDRVKIVAWPTREPSSKLFALNLLTPGNRELILSPGRPPRWPTATAAGTKTSWFTEGTKQDVHAKGGIFRVWSSLLSDPHGSPYFWPKSYPLTVNARAAVAKWNPDKNSIQVGCTPKGMPTIMEQPYPMQFVDKGDTILLRMEEYDTVRTIHLNAEAPRPLPAPQLLGYSVGQWMDDTLVVTTSSISWPYFDSTGVPQSTSTVITERFTPSKDGSRLEYKAVATDPNVFTQPVAIERHWVWRPDEKVKPYNCGA